MDHRWPSLWRFGSHLKTYHEWLDEACVVLVQGEYGEDWVSWAACSATGCPGLCVLEFKYSAAPTRRTTETAVGTGLPNHCLHQAYWFYFLNSFICSLQCCVLVISVFEDFDRRLSQFPQFNFFSLFVFILCYPVFTLSILCACLHFIMMTMLVFCYVYFWVLIPLLVVLRLEFPHRQIPQWRIS